MKPVVEKMETIKLTILYIMLNFHTPITDMELDEIGVRDCEMNYIFMHQGLEELKGIKYVVSYEQDGKVYYQLTTEGKQAIEMMHKKLSYALRYSIVNYIKYYTQDKKRAVAFDCDYVSENDVEYNVHCTYTEGDRVIFDIKFLAGDKEKAKEICVKLRQKGDKCYTELYKTIMKLAK